MRRFALWIIVSLLCQAVVMPADDLPKQLKTFPFRRENILGTSLDLTICAFDVETAQKGEAAALEEIERLRKILSTYDPSSEISKVNASHAPVATSKELRDVLEGYDVWIQRSKGAYSGQLGGVIQLWRDAEKQDHLPEASAIAKLVSRMPAKAWIVDSIDRTVTRLTDQTLNIDSLGKGFIIGKAVRAITRDVPEVRGILLNIGGDIRVWGQMADGKPAWKIGVADPAHPGDNATPLTTVQLIDRAISTSAAYERGFTIQGKRYSHIFDPRTGHPAKGVASATVVASDNVMANALATMLCVLKPQDGLAVVGNLLGVECLIVGEDGTQFRSPGFSAFEPSAKKIAPAVSNWPEGFAVSLNLVLKSIPGGKRPYVVVWVEDSQGKPVRTVSLWAGNMSYVESLSEWSRISELSKEKYYMPVTRATRQAGKYTIVWDGTDNLGRAVEKGDYTMTLEVAREHGGHPVKSATIHCGTEPASTVIPGASEFDDSVLKYGPVEEMP